MAKSGKGPLISNILLGVGIVVQVAIIVIVVLFIQDSKEAQKFQEIQGAKESSEWSVPLEELAENEQIILRQYILNPEQTLRSYWHSEDQAFRLTVKSPALKELMRQRILMVKEGKVGNHLVLTVYYNPLRKTKPEAGDLIPIYQVIRYEKPELAKLYTQQQSQGGSKKSLIETVKEKLTGKQESEESASNTASQVVVKEEDLYYPFEADQIIKDDENYVIYASVVYGENEDLINKDFLSPYLDESSFQGDYGWENGIFYWDVDAEEETEETVSTEAESK